VGQEQTRNRKEGAAGMKAPSQEKSGKKGNPIVGGNDGKRKRENAGFKRDDGGKPDYASRHEHGL
jgi:hypothetical protein